MKVKIPALARAINILNFIADHGKSNANEIINELGIPKSSAYLLLDELKNYKYISQDDNGYYYLWVKLVELGERASSRFDIRETAKKHLAKLTEKTGLLSHLGILENETAYYISKFESHNTISVRSYVGKQMSLYRSGIGKCLLAWQAEEKIVKIVDQIKYEQKTETTIMTRDDLLKELTKIRRQGWSFDNGEDYMDVRCVAAPIFNSQNKIIAAISAVGAAFQITDDVLPELVEVVRSCAQDISKDLGCTDINVF